MFLTVKESINNQSFRNVNSQEGEASMPWGQSECEYRLIQSGKKEMTKFKADRLDEGMFDLADGSGKKVVRWNRNLLIDNNEGSPKIKYEDGYIVNRSNDPSSEKRSSVRTIIVGEARSKLCCFIWGISRF